MLRGKSIFFIFKVEKFFLLVAALSNFYDILMQIHDGIDIFVLCTNLIPPLTSSYVVLLCIRFSSLHSVRYIRAFLYSFADS